MEQNYTQNCLGNHRVPDLLILVSTVDDVNDANSDLMRIDDNATYNGGSEEKVAKSRGPSEGDGGGRQQVGGVYNEQRQA